MKNLLSKSFLFAIALLFVAASCGQKDDDAPVGNPVGNNGGNNSNTWLIPKDDVFDGGPGKDGIPSIDSPNFSDASQTTFLQPNDLVLGIKVGDEVRAYPHPILDWHEIVNDEVNGKRIAITYCPLTGTGIGWEREVNGSTTTFGVSGLLYNTNLLPYDRNTNSNWSQMLLKAVNGSLAGEEIVTYPMVETTWQTWLSMYPNSKVMNTETGFNRSYGNYPYGGYRTDHDQMLFPINPDDSRLPRKQRGLGVIADGKAKFYPFDKFDAPVAVQQDAFKGINLVIVGSKPQNFLAAYDRRLPDGTVLEFTAVAGTGNATVMTDNEGNEWNFFGEAVAGPRKGTWLAPTDSFIGYWLAWGAFYPGVEVF